MKHLLQLRAGGGGGRKPAAALATLIMMMALAQPAVAQTFLAPDIEVDEGDKATFKVTLPGAYNGSLRWAYQTEEGTADSGDDYTAASGYLVISAGGKTGSVVVQTAEDDVADDGETFKLKLSNFETQGFSRNNPDQWTSAFSLSGVPTEKTMTATIKE